MGFKFKRVNFTCGSADFPEGNTDALRRTRSESVLKAVADALIAMNIGWQLDASRSGDSSTTSDFANVPCISGGLTFPGLFFVNSVSGCKLFVAYFGGSTDDSSSIKDFAGSAASPARVIDLFGAGSSPHIAGLIMSIIPAGSSSTFGSSFNSSFLPSDATRLMGSQFSADSYGYQTLAYNPTAGFIYSYGIYATEYVLCPCMVSGNGDAGNLGAPVYAAGRILGTLAHAEDTAINAEYGTVAFRVSDSYLEGAQGIVRASQTYIFSLNATVYFPGDGYWISGTRLSDLTRMCISKSDGAWLNGYTGSSNVTFYTSDPAQIGGYVFNSSGTGKSRWSSLAVTALAQDLSVNGVVSGDGFKGYLDTTLFRCARGTFGQLFDNGNFICPHGNFNLLLGWDPDNTDSIGG